MDYAGRGDLFEGLSIWEDEQYRALQGTYPVISLSFARIKESNYEQTKRKICEIITNAYIKYSFLLDSDVLTDKDRAYSDSVTFDMDDVTASSALYQLSDFLYRYYGKKVIILLDEYDTPIQDGDYTVTANRESGYGRYDVMIEPRDRNRNAYILEFKLHDTDDEQTLEDTLRAAHAQIEEKQYEASLVAKGIPSDHIYKYGFAFEGKKVLIG